MSAKGGAQASENAGVTLANGLRVLCRERHAAPLVAVDLWVRAGAREEMPNEAGSAHFLEHTLFKGTTTRAAGQADWDIENLGGLLNAATGPDYAHFYVTVATPNVPRALAILADVVQNATLPDAQVERERGVILDELAEHASDPAAQAVDVLYAAAFPARPYGRSPGGSPEALRLRGRDTLAGFYRRCYQPARCTLVLAGDLSGEQARQWAGASFGAWQSSAPVPPGNAPRNSAYLPGARQPMAAPNNMPTGGIPQNEPPSPAPTDADAPHQENAHSHHPVYAATSESALALAVPLLPARRVTLHGPTDQAALGLGLPAPPAQDARLTAAAALAAEILGGAGRGGRLDSSAFAHTQAQARYIPRRDVSLWLVTAILPRSAPPARVQTKLLEEALRNALIRLRDAPAAPLELLSAQQRLLARLDTDTESNEALAQAVGYADITGGDAPEAFRQRVSQTTSADIRQFVTRYLLAQSGVTVVLLPANDASGGSR